jgi:hypothetical protein
MIKKIISDWTASPIILDMSILVHKFNKLISMQQDATCVK